MKRIFLLIVNGKREIAAYTTLERAINRVFSLPKNPLLKTLDPGQVRRKVEHYGKYVITSEKYSIELYQLEVNPSEGARQVAKE